MSPDIVVDFETFVAGGFAGFTTDVFSNQDAFSSGSASAFRTADGDSVRFLANESWSQPAAFVVRTGVTEFDEGGVGVIETEFLGLSPIDGMRYRSFQFDSFGPAAGPSPNPIPLPPAAWAAAGTMLGFGAVRRLRRRK